MNDSLFDRRRELQVWLREAEEEVRHGHFEKAEDLLTLAEIEHGEALGIVALRASVAQKAGKLPEALDLWARARILAPGPGAYAAAVSILLRLSRFNEGDALAIDGLFRFPGHPALLSEFAWSAHLSERWREAAGRWDAFRRHETKPILGFVNSAIAYRKCGKIARAEQVLEEGLVLAPEHRELLTDYAACASDVCQWHEAVARWRRVRLVFPGDRKAYFNEGRALRNLGNYEESEAVFALGQKTFPDDRGFENDLRRSRALNRVSHLDLGSTERLRLATYIKVYDNWDYHEEIGLLPEAVVLPQTKFTDKHEFIDVLAERRHILNGGVYDAQGGICPWALYEAKEGLRHVPDPYVPPQNPVRLSGTWLFAGFAFNHIGHFLTEGTGRLWGLGRREDLRGVIYMPFDNAQEERPPSASREWRGRFADANSRPGFMSQVLQFFGNGGAVQFVVDPLVVERLLVPSQLMGLLPYGELLGAHPTYRAYVRQRLSSLLSEGEPGKAGLKLYVSRSQFYRPETSFFMEDAMDACFRADGYQVIYPERLSLAEQLRLYAAASHIVAAAGSALHVIALAMTGHQNVAILKRFPGQIDQFRSQVESMGGRHVSVHDCLLGCFMPIDPEERRRFGVNPMTAVCAVDMKRLWRNLWKEGFVSSPSSAVGLPEFQSRADALCRQLQERYQSGPFSLISP